MSSKVASTAWDPSGAPGGGWTAVLKYDRLNRALRKAYADPPGNTTEVVCCGGDGDLRS